MKKPPCNDPRNEKLRIIDWSVALMHQTETKSLSVLGFYMAFAGVLIGFLLTEPLFAQAALTVFFVFLLGGFTISILWGYRDWKLHYLEIIQTNLKELEILNNDLPTSFRWNPNARVEISSVSVDTIILAIPHVYLVIAVLICFYYYAYKPIMQLL